MVASDSEDDRPFITFEEYCQEGLRIRAALQKKREKEQKAKLRQLEKDKKAAEEEGITIEEYRERLAEEAKRNPKPKPKRKPKVKKQGKPTRNLFSQGLTRPMPSSICTDDDDLVEGSDTMLPDLVDGQYVADTPGGQGPPKRGAGGIVEEGPEEETPVRDDPIDPDDSDEDTAPLSSLQVPPPAASSSTAREEPRPNFNPWPLRPLAVPRGRPNLVRALPQELDDDAAPLVLPPGTIHRSMAPDGMILLASGTLPLEFSGKMVKKQVPKHQGSQRELHHYVTRWTEERPKPTGNYEQWHQALKMENGWVEEIENGHWRIFADTNCDGKKLANKMLCTNFKIDMHGESLG